MQIQENKEMIGMVEMEEPRIRERFQIYQDMRAYIRDLLECLSEKVSIFGIFILKQLCDECVLLLI